MRNIDKEKHKELISILEKLIKIITEMNKENEKYLLTQNKNESIDWLDFLKRHTDKEELKSLENEISDRFFFKFDIQLEESELDKKRTELMKKYLFKSNEYLK